MYAKRPRLLDGRVGLPVREHLERGTLLLKVLGNKRHGSHLPSHEALRRPGGRRHGEAHAAVAPTVPGGGAAAEHFRASGPLPGYMLSSRPPPRCLAPQPCSPWWCGCPWSL
jgi:hypothetical protein